MNFLSFFIPHKKNNYHAYFLRPLFLFCLVFTVFVANFLNILPVNNSTQAEKILGIGSNIVKDEIIRLTNQERKNNGLSELSNNSTLDQAAVLKAQDMISKNYWAHNSPDGVEPWYFFSTAGYKYKFAGENLAKNFDNSSQVVAAWMNSQGHKENILSPKYQEIGIAVMNGSLQGEETTLVVQLFGATTTPVAVAQAEEKAEVKVTEENPVAVAQVQKTTTIASPLPSPTPASSPAESPHPTIAFVQETPPVTSPQEVLVQAINSSLNTKFTWLMLLFILSLFIIDKWVLTARRVVRTHTGQTDFHILALFGLIIMLVILSKGHIL